MSDRVQYIIVGIVIAASVVFLIRYIILSIRAGKQEDIKCAGCPIADKCTHNHSTCTHKSKSSCSCH